MRRTRSNRNARSGLAASGRGLAACGCVRWPAMGRRAAQASEPTAMPHYASPLEVLLSPDGARLYVLCQQSEEVRVLDAASYAVIKNIAVGRVPRGFSLSPDGRGCL